MHGRKLHLHSMLVHSVLALAPLAAAAFVLAAAEVRVAGFDTDVWRFLVVAALAIMLLAALPATVSGVLERAHMYVTWHGTHKAKLALSLALVTAVAVELARLLGGDPAPRLLSPVGGLVVVVNPCLAFLLSAFGLKMSLGRQALARTSYVPDLFRDPPLDLLAINAGHLAEPPDVIDILQEATR